MRTGVRGLWYGLGLGAIGLVGVLITELRALQSYPRLVRRMRSLPYAGQWMPTAKVVTTTGDTLLVGETNAGRAQLVIFFSPKCPYCLASLPAWRKLSDSLLNDTRSRFDVTWVTNGTWDSTSAYAARHRLSYTIGRFVDAKMPMVMKTRVVPLTLVLDRFGRVEYVHVQAVEGNRTLDSLLSAAFRAAAADSIVAAAGPSSRQP